MKDFTKPVGKEDTSIFRDGIDAIIKAIAAVGNSMMVIISKVFGIK
jgi:hypothetical protein